MIVAPNNKIFFIQEKFNNYHERIKFTIEKMNNNKLKFLDVIRVNNTIVLDCSQKIISSGRTLSFLSNHPFHQKVGVLYGLIDRACCRIQCSITKT